MDIIERDIYALICSKDGIKAKDIAKTLHRERSQVNHYLYSSPYMHELCYQDKEFKWHGIIRQGRPHRGLFHSFRDTYQTMRALFEDLCDIYEPDWEILFELRIKRARYIRIYADVLVITGKYVFSLEFKMNHSIEENEVAQAAKYSPYLEVIFGPKYEVIPVLVLTKAEDLYRYVQLPKSTAEIPVCSGDMLFNVFDEYLGFLK